MTAPFPPSPALRVPVPSQSARVAPAQALVRTAAPDLARRAQIERTRGRLVFAAAGFGVLFLAVATKLTFATVLDPMAPKLRAAATVPTGEAPLMRGTITDRNGEVLAVSLRVTELYANPQEISDPITAATRLRTVLPQLDAERLVARLTKRNVPGTERPLEFAYLARNLPPRQMLEINNLGIPGLYFRAAERRFHPQGNAAAHLLGQVDVDGHGIAGVERSFDTRLREDRAPLRLSVDIRLQVALREAILKAIEDFRGVGGAGVVLDAQTGEVLAMVSLPDFDLSDPTPPPRPTPGRNAGPLRPDQDPHFNRATVGLYEPGSTFKLFTTAMALELGTVNLWGGYDASRPIRYGRFQIDDFKGKHRWLAVPEIVAYSSNIASAHMAAHVGPARHREFMGRMGMLSRLGLEVPEVARPLAPSEKAWRDINTMTIGFGHGISVSPLHVVNGVAALANGGILRAPTILAQPAGGTPREGTRVISERTSDHMRRLMRLVVTEGSGKGAEVPGYFVGGKTGTAQKVSERGAYLENKRIAAFVGAFPMNAPRYAIYVMVDEPKPNAQSHGYATAGWVAAPAAGAVVRRIAPILGLVPETEAVPAIAQSIAMPLQPGRPARAVARPPLPAVPSPAPAAVPVQGGPPAPLLRRTGFAPGGAPAGASLAPG